MLSHDTNSSGAVPDTRVTTVYKTDGIRQLVLNWSSVGPQSVQLVTQAPSQQTNMSRSTELTLLIQRTQLRFNRACSQVQHLNQRLDEIEARYERSKTNSNSVFRYNLKLKMCVVEGTRNYFFEYVQRIGAELYLLQIERRDVAPPIREQSNYVDVRR